MTGFPIYRPRRLRATENLRSLIRETSLSVKDLIFPLFVVPGENVKNEIETLKNNYQWSVDRVMEAVDEAVELGIPAVLKPSKRNIRRWWSSPTPASANTPPTVTAAF